MLSKTKKALILSGMLLLLVVTGYLNIVLNANSDNNDKDADADAAMSFFDSHRVARQTARDQALLVLNGIIADPNSSDEAIANATEEKMAISEAIQLEVALESLIKAKGFEDAVVTYTKDQINVIVNLEEELTSADVAQILDIIVTQTGASPTNVRVSQI